ncbi:MAG: hypothetical protein HOV80_17700 [Polyangiaceae bacterium]|nr:hypothetical protein [Polyangiaceae bacterium]
MTTEELIETELRYLTEQGHGPLARRLRELCLALAADGALARLEVAVEKAARERTQRHLDDFQGTVGQQAIEIMRLKKELAAHEAGRAEANARELPPYAQGRADERADVLAFMNASTEGARASRAKGHRYAAWALHKLPQLRFRIENGAHVRTEALGTPAPVAPRPGVCADCKQVFAHNNSCGCDPEDEHG